MRLARFRRLAWVLVLVLLAGLASPAFASLPDAGQGAAVAPVAHVHADGTAHVHARPPASDGEKAAAQVGTKPTKAPPHCPGCLSAADCAISCLGMGLLPALTAMPAGPARVAWTASATPAPVGASPAGDLDPPRPVSVR